MNILDVEPYDPEQKDLKLPFLEKIITKDEYEDAIKGYKLLRGFKKKRKKSGPENEQG